MFKKGLIYFICSALLTTSVFSEETCSRIAIINHQEVLVDSSSSQKGEGLRFHLEKDEIAKTYLDQYQSYSSLSWQSATIGTLGTGLIIGGIASGDNKGKRNTLLMSGIGLIMLNFLIAKTMEKSNEHYLHKAIEEYNLRNLPRIHYNPLEQGASRNPSSSPTIGLEKSWSF
jgi:hypothetical protein